VPARSASRPPRTCSCGRAAARRAGYANVAEFGNGIYGAQAASRTYFGKDASRLTPAESARLAAVLPSPRRYDAARPGPYVQKRSNGIQRQMHHLGGGGYLRQAR